jgi:glycosyltransferase involved in cell wall biosynthesis
MSTQSISVVIPAYNAAPFLGEALDSVFAETRPAVEVIVVDDWSSDDSATIAERAGARVFRLPQNRGPFVAYNVGIAASRGELIAHQAADDLWHPHHLDHVAGLLDGCPEAAVACAGVRMVGTRTGEWLPHELPDRQSADAFWPSFGSTIVPHNTAIIRRALWDKLGGYDESRRVAMDFDFWLRAARLTRFIVSHRITADYRWHGAQISSHPLTQLQSVYWSRRRMVEELHGEPELHRRALDRLRAIWNNDLREAVWAGDRNRARALLTLAGSLPGIPQRDRIAGGFRLWTPAPLRPLGRRLLGLARA